jgi:class 3 adenylate cyclase
VGAPRTERGPAEAQARFSSPDTYTPKHLAEKILISKAALEGERKQVTVLFADLKGSMELLADRDPEEARKLLDPVLERMMEAVHRRGHGQPGHGRRDWPSSARRWPTRITRCGPATAPDAGERRVRGRGATLTQPWSRSASAELGEVVVRAIGSDLHMDYTAVGQTHLAARMEQIADPGAIVITPGLLALAEATSRKSLGPCREGARRRRGLRGDRAGQRGPAAGGHPARTDSRQP